MDRNVEKFIERKDERKNSANAKLKLLVYGVKDNPEIFKKYQSFFKEEHYAYDNGNWNVDKNRLTPSEILLPGGIVSKLHIRPDSPLTLALENEFKKILEVHQLSETDIFARYDAVFHMESTAVGDAELYNKSTNKFRFSSPEQARIQERKTIEIWEKHTNFHFIPVEKNFEIKMQKLKALVLKELESKNLDEKNINID